MKTLTADHVFSLILKLPKEERQRLAKMIATDEILLA
jgi:hypothetical protein